MSYITETIYGKAGQDNLGKSSGGILSFKSTGKWEVTCRGTKAKCEASAKSDRFWGHSARVVRMSK
jgi:hypothetical protein